MTDFTHRREGKWDRGCWETFMGTPPARQRILLSGYCRNRNEDACAPEAVPYIRRGNAAPPTSLEQPLMIWQWRLRFASVRLLVLDRNKHTFSAAQISTYVKHESVFPSFLPATLPACLRLALLCCTRASGTPCHMLSRARVSVRHVSNKH